MFRFLALWLLFGALGLTGYEAYLEYQPSGETGEVHTMEGGNGLPPPGH